MNLEWVKKNKKLSSKILGVNFLLMTLVLMFWSQPTEVMSENEKAMANIARLEAQANGSSSKAKASSSESIMKEYKETQKTQLRIFLVLMFISGVGFLGYGFFKQESPVEDD